MPSDAIENATCPITEITSHADLSNVSAMYAATLPADLAGNLPEGTVFQIMPDAAIWTVTDSDSVPKGVLTSKTFILNDGKTAIQQISSPVSNVHKIEVSNLQSCSVQSSAEQITVHSERNITDLDLSFLNDSDHELNAVSENSSNQTSNELMNDPLSVSVNDSQVSSPGPHVDSNFSVTDQGVITDTETLVMVDVSKPIQLSQNSLIVVNGKKCVLQQDSQTGQVVAYPVAEPDKPKKKRGRPKKIIHEVEDHRVNSEPYVKITQYFEDISDDETISKKGLLEVINDDGARVRRSSRKRKRTKLLKDYETGNLNQEIGSDIDDTPLSMKHDCALTRKKSRQRTVGRTKKGSSLSSDNANNRRILKGKVEQSKISMVEPEQAQSFLIQTADGQQLMIQVPFSSIPPGMSVHDIAQDIADTINFGASHIQNNSTSNSSESLAAAPDSEVANNSSVIASLPLDVNASRLCSEENIYPSTDVEPKNLNLSLENTKINTDMQFTSTISSEMNSCTTIEIANPSQSNMSEFEYALAYSAPLPDFGSSTAVSKAAFADNSVFALETYQCTKCEFNTVYDNEYQRHLNLHSENIEECKNCKFTYSKEEELFEHFRKSHPRWICTECNYIAEHPSDIKQHINEHSDTGCLCVVCGKTYKDQYILKMHVKLVHLPAEILFKCHLCDKQFNRKAHLKRHLRTHGPEKPFKCSYCEYRGCEKSDLTKHMLIHEEPKHECEFCGKTFRHIKNKELHIKRHKNQRDYKCGICEFFGYTFTDVRKHIEKVHTSSKINSCNKCEQVFNSYKLMQKHQNNGQCEALAFKRKEQLDSSLLQAVCKSKKKKVVEEEDTLNFAEESGEI